MKRLSDNTMKATADVPPSHLPPWQLRECAANARARSPQTPARATRTPRGSACNAALFRALSRTQSAAQGGLGELGRVEGEHLDKARIPGPLSSCRIPQAALFKMLSPQR